MGVTVTSIEVILVMGIWDCSEKKNKGKKKTALGCSEKNREKKTALGYSEKKQRKKQNCTLVAMRKTKEETKLYFGCSEKNRGRKKIAL